jgi:hypothetical protein
MAGESNWLWLAAGLVVAVVALLGAIVWRRGRPFAAGSVFRASRLSRGNHLFPTQVLITATSVVRHTPRWVGRHEETIHMAHISSVRIDTGVLLSNIYIETSGGANPIACHGHRKRDATRMQALIEQYQTAYFRGADAPAPQLPKA